MISTYCFHLLLLFVVDTWQSKSAVAGAVSSRGSVTVSDDGNLLVTAPAGGTILLNGLDALQRFDELRLLSLQSTNKCPAGTYPRDGLCQICPFGTFSVGDNQPCVQCPEGTTTDPQELRDGEPRSSYHQADSDCQTSRYPENSHAFCADRVCRFSDTPVTANSTRPAGYKVVLPLGVYEMCPPGMYKPLVDTLRDTSCRYCPRDTYSDTFGAKACKSCPPGRYTF